MEKSKIKVKLIDILNHMFANAGVNPDLLCYVDLIDDLGMDSMSFISIVIEVESMFDITVPDEMLLMENFRNVDKIIEIVEKEKNFIKSATNEQEDT